MADDDPILAALGLKAPGTYRYSSFQVSDTVLAAAMLAGGVDPTHNLMDTFRKCYGNSSARVSGTMKLPISGRSRLGPLTIIVDYSQ
jgi:hypothetical protein